MLSFVGATMTTAPPPALPGSFFTGNLLEFQADPLAFAERAARECGDVARFRFLMLDAWQVIHPDDVRTVFVDPEGALTKGMALEGFRPLVGQGTFLAEGAAHKRQRRLLQPAFLRPRVVAMEEPMVAAVREGSASWQDGQTLDAAAALTEMTLTIAARTLFGSEIAPAEVSTVAQAMAAFARWYHQSIHPLGPLLQLLPTTASRDFKAAKAGLDAVVTRAIEARRAAGGEGGDILSRLVAARDEEGDGQGLTDALLHDEAVGLLVAGHETTAAALSWAIWLLAQHPTVGEALAEEVDRVLGGRPATASDVAHLPVAEGVFAEALRLYPPAPGMPRQTHKPMALGRYTVPKGSIVMVSAWCSHRDPRWWPDPLEFQPGRWQPEVRASRPKYAFYPFGGGSRVCVGEQMAWQEGVLVLATLAQGWRFSPAPGAVVVTEALFTVRPKGGAPVVVSRR